MVIFFTSQPVCPRIWNWDLGSSKKRVEKPQSGLTCLSLVSHTVLEETVFTEKKAKPYRVPKEKLFPAANIISSLNMQIQSQ